MPFYTYLCETCGGKDTRYAKISGRDEPVGTPCLNAGCSGTLIRPPEIPGFTSSESLGRIKAPAEFRDLLKAIKKENPGSTIPER